MISTINSPEILSFWFGKLEAPDVWDESQAERWFRKNPLFDSEVKNCFEPLLQTHPSPTTADTYLAAIIVFDQFPRNIYRDSSQAFQYDATALDLAQKGVELGLDKELFPIQRFFFYLPFMHSEKLHIQEQALKLYADLLEDAPESKKEAFARNLDYAERHHKIIERFGRFPHRNIQLGRTSTPDEIAFLKEPGSSTQSMKK